MTKPRQNRCWECRQWAAGVAEGRLYGADGTTGLHLYCAKKGVYVQPTCFCTAGEWESQEVQECPLKHN